jgi:hypothetical protein
MSDTDAHTPEPFGAGDAVSVHTLRPQPPVRAFLIAAVVSVAGAVLTVVGAANGWPGGVIALWVVILIAGLALLGAGIWSMWRMQVRAELTPTGYTFRTPAGVRHGTWSETTRVTASESGRRISFHHRDETVDHVICPVDANDPTMAELVEDVTSRLKDSRS